MRRSHGFSVIAQVGISYRQLTVKLKIFALFHVGLFVVISCAAACLVRTTKLVLNWSYLRGHGCGYRSNVHFAHYKNQQLVDELEQNVLELQSNLENTKLRLEDAKKRCAVTSDLLATVARLTPEVSAVIVAPLVSTAGTTTIAEPPVPQSKVITNLLQYYLLVCGVLRNNVTPAHIFLYLEKNHVCLTRSWPSFGQAGLFCISASIPISKIIPK